MRCPKCNASNPPKATECDGCGVVFGHLRSDKSAATPIRPDLCAFVSGCPCRGILSTTTNGVGQWYCREHWARLNRIEPDVIGNAIPDRAKRPDESVIDYLQRVPQQ